MKCLSRLRVPFVLMNGAWIILLFSGAALSQRTQAFAGKWVGTFENTLGDRGDDFLTLEEDSDGRLHGT
jgi:hypothetical protein